jgi:4'-phosphopantetheinyl transferase
MKYEHKNTYLGRNGSLLDRHPAEQTISIDFAKLEICPGNRGQRRALQSRVARQLLNHSLHRLSGENIKSFGRIEKTHAGKPFLTGDNSPSISLAHSGKWIACAVGNISQVGIDIETVKPHDWDAYSQDIFHEEEALWVLSGPKEQRDIRGLICWCRKEAIVKALGTGMTVHPSKIAFTPEGELIALPSSLGNLSDWKTYSRALFGKAVMAVAWKI